MMWKDNKYSYLNTNCFVTFFSIFIILIKPPLLENYENANIKRFIFWSFWSLFSDGSSMYTILLKDLLGVKTGLESLFRVLSKDA